MTRCWLASKESFRTHRCCSRPSKTTSDTSMRPAMTQAPTADPPLLGLFLRLREAGLPLGIDEYLLAVRGLQAGFGQPDRIALRRLCAALWVKSADDERLFAAHFDKALTVAASYEAD